MTWRQKFRPRLWYDVRLQGLYVGSAQLLELAYLWDPPSCESYIWAAALQIKQNDLCAQRRLRSTRASAITMGSWGPNVSSCGQRRLWSTRASAITMGSWGPNVSSCGQRRLRSTRASTITMGNWGPNVSSCGQRRLWSDWADVQADLSLRWAQRSFCWFGRTAVHIKASHAVKRS